MATASFVEVTNFAGVAYTGPSFGASWGDFNQDTLPDLWVINHAFPDTLFLNQGNGTFTDISSTTFEPEFYDSHGSAWADFDNDGDKDITILVGAGSQTGLGQRNRLYVNNNGLLTDEAEARGISYSLGRGRTPVWIDYDNDGLLDLWVGNLARQNREAPPTLFKQDNNNTFVDVGQAVGVNVGQSDFAILADLTGDGKLDLINRGFDPSNNFSKLTVYDMSSSPFQNVTNEWIPTGLDADDIVSADFDNDLKIDLFLIESMEDGGDVLLINNGETLINSTAASGISSGSTESESVVAGDFDNDMDVDIYILRGSSQNNTPNELYENQGDGTFILVPEAGGASGTDVGTPDSVIVADYDLNGFLDLFITNGEGTSEPRGSSQLFQNQGNQNNWIEILLEGIVSNRDAVGAQVFVTSGGVTQLREQSGGIHKFSQNSSVLHFGLGSNTIIDKILIKWPSGIQQTLSNLTVNQLVQIQEEAANSNLPPSIVSASSISMLENQVFVVDVSATDPEGEAEGSGLSYSIVGGADSSLFSIDSDTGELGFIAAPDFENPTDAGDDNVYEVQVEASDSTGLTDSQLISVTVTDVNESSSLYEAEDADLTGVLILAGRGSSGGEFVDFQNAADDIIAWTVNAPTAGVYDLTWRYTNGSSNRPLALTINGDVFDESLDFPTTGGWYSNGWDFVTQSVGLNAGNNTVELTAIGSSGANFDYLSMVSTEIIIQATMILRIQLLLKNWQSLIGSDT